MKVKYPNGIVTATQRYKYLYKLEELLRLELNDKGTDYRNEKITEAEWVAFRINRFKPCKNAISEEICRCRNQLKEEAKIDESINASLDDLIEEE